MCIFMLSFSCSEFSWNEYFLLCMFKGTEILSPSLFLCFGLFRFSVHPSLLESSFPSLSVGEWEICFESEKAAFPPPCWKELAFKVIKGRDIWGCCHSLVGDSLKPLLLFYLLPPLHLKRPFPHTD